MADPQEETVGHVTNAPEAKEETPVQKDTVKENGELPAAPNHEEIGGKGKEDPSLGGSTAPEVADTPGEAENGESAIPSGDAAKDTDSPSPPPQEETSSPSEEVKEAGEVSEEVPQPTDTQESESGHEGIEEGFLSLVGLGEEPSPSDDVPEAQGEPPESEGTEKEPAAEGILKADEPQAAEPAQTEQAEETTEKGPSEENPETVPQKEAEVEETPKSADSTDTNNDPIGVPAEETTKPVDSAQTDDLKTEVAEGGIGEPLESAKTEEPDTPVDEAEAPKSTETSEPEAVGVGEEGTPPKSEEKSYEPAGTEVAEEEIPKTADTTDDPTGAAVPEAVPKALETTETNEPGGAEVAEKETKPLDTTEADQPKGTEVAEDEILKTVDTTETGTFEPQIAEDETPKPSEADESKAADVPEEEKIEPTADVTDTAEEPKAAEIAGEDEKGLSVGGDTAEEPKAAVTSEDDSATDAGESTPTVGEEAAESKTVEEGTPKEVPASPSTTPVEQEQPIEAEDPSKPKSFFGVVLKPVGSNGKSLEVQPNAEDGTVLDSDSADKSLEEAQEKAHLPADIAEQEVGETPNVEKEGGQPEVGEAPNVKMESEATPKEVSPEVLKVVSSGPEPSGNSTTETPESVEQGNVDDSSKEIGMPSPAVEEKESPPGDIPTELPASAPEETGQDPLEGTAGNTEEPKEIPPTTTPEDKPVDGEETRAIPEDAPTEPSSTDAAEAAPKEKEVYKVEEPITPPMTAAEDTIDQLTTEGTSKEAKPKEGTSLPVKEETVEEKPAGEDGSVLVKQPSLSTYVPQQEEEATATEAETPDGSDLTTPRGTPLMQRVEQLEDKLAQLESRQSPTSYFASTEESTPRSSIDKPFKHSTRYVLEETGSKGTLLDRVAALEQKLAYINLHPPSPMNDQSTPPVAAASEDTGTEPDSKPAESQTREWTPSETEGDKAPEQVNSEEASKAAEDPVKPNTEEKPPQDVVPAQAKPVSTARSNSLTEKKIRAKAAVGKLAGIFGGCFSPKAST